MALLMGLAKVLPHPDLVIVGPNPGNNVGAINTASGTFNAAGAALLAGVPALAVSTDLKEQDSQRVAQLVTRLVDRLASQRGADGRLLPPGVGLNVNLPPLAKLIGVRITRVGSYVPFSVQYTDDLAALFPAQAGKPGISFAHAPAPSAEQRDDEAVRVAEGYLTISPFTALPGAPASADKSLAELTALPLAAHPEHTP
ncbi:MAG: 5'/3'-nucleotidase SurE [Pseudomonas citronellolis]|nr:MAG: 5'/3'-nucleotidase SurE [Pseudomonas citronellolis]